MSRSGNEINEVDDYQKLISKIKEVDAIAEKMYAKTTTLDKQQRHIIALQAAIARISMQCRGKATSVSKLESDLQEHIDKFNEMFKKENSAADNPLNGFQIAAAANGARLPPPRPAAYGLGLYGKPASEKPEPLPESVANFLNDKTNKAVLTQKLVDDLKNQPPEVCFQAVTQMISKYKEIINAFVNDDDKNRKKQHPVRKEATRNLLTDLSAIAMSIRPADDSSVAQKVANIKAMIQYFDYASTMASDGGKKNLVEPTFMGKHWNTDKVSVTNIFGRWEKEKAPFESMTKVLEAKFGIVKQTVKVREEPKQNPSSPKLG
jgi:hypothetical protein